MEHNIKTIQITRNKGLKPLVFTDDQLMITDMKLYCWQSVHKLDSLVSKYGLTNGILRNRLHQAQDSN